MPGVAEARRRPGAASAVTLTSGGRLSEQVREQGSGTASGSSLPRPWASPQNPAVLLGEDPRTFLLPVCASASVLCHTT